MTIDRTITGIEGRIDLGKLRICFSLNRPRYVLLPLIAIWRICPCRYIQLPPPLPVLPVIGALGDHTLPAAMLNGTECQAGF